MINPRQRNVIRQRVHTRIREKMSGTAERPRLNVYRSLNHIYTQLIDDAASRRWSLTVAAICITAASRLWPTPLAKLAWTSRLTPTHSI